MKKLFLAALAAAAVVCAQGVDWSQIKNKPLLEAKDYTFPPQQPGGTLTAGSPDNVTLKPCPKGVNGSNIAYYMYISGGTGTAETVLITGGSCTTGASTGTVAFTPANNHTGAWTISSASEGLQEAVCALPSTGGEAVVRSNITLRADVSVCGKVAVLIEKTAGVTIAGGKMLLKKKPYGVSSEKYTSQDMANVVAFMPQGTCPVNWLPYDAGIVFGRCNSEDIGNSSTQSVIAVQQDFHGVTGVPWTITSQLNLDKLTGNSGVGAVVAYTTKTGTATGIAFGVHGTCNSSTGGPCAGVNAEADQLVDTPGLIIGLNANIGTVSVGTSWTAWALNASVTFPSGGVNPGGAGYFRSGGGEHEFGVRIAEQMGKFDNMLELISGQSTDNVSLYWNAYPSGAIGYTSQIHFARGATIPKQVGGIVSDAVTPSSFANGYVSVQARVDDAVTDVGKFSIFGLTLLSRTAAQLAATPSPDGSILYCSNCSIASSCTAGGTGSFAKRLNAAWICN
jgi:hypothetical protein